MRERMSMCAGEYGWSYVIPVWAYLPHALMWTASCTGREMHAQAQPHLAHTPATLALLLPSLRWPTPGLWPPVTSGYRGLHSHITPRLHSQMKAIQPHRQNSLLLILFLPSPLSSSPSVLSFLSTSQAHPHSLSLSLSFCVSERRGSRQGRGESHCGVGSH